MIELKLVEMLPRGRCGELAPLNDGRPPPPPLDRVGVTVSLTGVSGGCGCPDNRTAPGEGDASKADGRAGGCSGGGMLVLSQSRAVRGSLCSSTGSSRVVTHPAAAVAVIWTDRTPVERTRKSAHSFRFKKLKKAHITHFHLPHVGVVGEDTRKNWQKNIQWSRNYLKMICGVQAFTFSYHTARRGRGGREGLFLC